MTSEALENWVQDWLHKLENVGDAFSSEEWKNFTHYIDWSAFEAKVEPLYLTITPTFLLVELEIFNQKKIYIISENYDLIPWNS